MMRKALIAAGPWILLAASGCTSSAPNQEGTRSTFGVMEMRGDSDEIVTLGQCPEAVQATIKAHLDGGSIKEIERTTDHGEVLYEVDVTGDEGIVEFDVAEDGAFRGYEEEDDEADENEEEIPLSDVPQNVKDAAIAAVPGIVLEEAERETEGDVVVYELEGEADGQEYEVEVNEAGEVLEVEKDEEDEGDDDDGEDDDD